MNSISAITEAYKYLLEECISSGCIDLEGLRNILDTQNFFSPAFTECIQRSIYGGFFNMLAMVAEEQTILSNKGDFQDILTNNLMVCVNKVLLSSQQSTKDYTKVLEEYSMLVNEKKIRSILADIAHADKQLLTAGVGYLVRDMDEYLSSRSQDDIAGLNPTLFLEIVNEMKQAGRRDQTGQGYADFLADISGPRGISLNSSNIVLDMSALLENNQGKKLAAKVGRTFLKKFKKRLKSIICDEKIGPYGQLKNSVIGKAAVPTTIATTILTSGFTAANVWYPLAVYVALLIAQAGLDAYCDKKSTV
ncbi:MAG: hypothetical protein HY962_08300 [Ignavibacteriae bacterium]|nr:hypothetical protein [Ignavibacteriota bacterium]